MKKLTRRTLRNLLLKEIYNMLSENKPKPAQIGSGGLSAMSKDLEGGGGTASKLNFDLKGRGKAGQSPTYSSLGKKKKGKIEKIGDKPKQQTATARKEKPKKQEKQKKKGYGNKTYLFLDKNWKKGNLKSHYAYMIRFAGGKPQNISIVMTPKSAAVPGRSDRALTKPITVKKEKIKTAIFKNFKAAPANYKKMVPPGGKYDEVSKELVLAIKSLRKKAGV